MFNNGLNGVFNQQQSIDRINDQIRQLEGIRNQIQQPMTPITQNFQLAPNRETIRYAMSIEEVKRDTVVGDTPYFAKDMSVVWVKNTKGEIKIYELNEIIPKDEKDIKIEYLQAQIEELKKGMSKNELNADVSEYDTTTSENEKPTSISTIAKFNKKSK